MKEAAALYLKTLSSRMEKCKLWMVAVSCLYISSYPPLPPAPSPPHPLPSAPHPQVGDNGDAFLARAGGQEKLVTAQSMATEFAVREAGDKEHIAEATLTNNAQDETIADLTTRLTSAEAAMKTMYEAHCTPPNMPCHAMPH